MSQKQRARRLATLSSLTYQQALRRLRGLRLSPLDELAYLAELESDQKRPPNIISAQRTLDLSAIAKQMAQPLKSSVRAAVFDLASTAKQLSKAFTPIPKLVAFEKFANPFPRLPDFERFANPFPKLPAFEKFANPFPKLPAFAKFAYPFPKLPDFPPLDENARRSPSDVA